MKLSVYPYNDNRPPEDGSGSIMKCLCLIYIRQWKMSSGILVSRSDDSYKPLDNRCQTHHILMPISNIHISIQWNDFCTT